jgi:lysyl-tRNA synthetase class 2
MPSTVIRRYAYCPDSEQLWVEFVTGRRYVYSGVPAETVEALGLAFAKGVYFNTRIRDHFPYREVTHADHATES